MLQNTQKQLLNRCSQSDFVKNHGWRKNKELCYLLRPHSYESGTDLFTTNEGEREYAIGEEEKLPPI